MTYKNSKKQNHFHIMHILHQDTHTDINFNFKIDITIQIMG